MGTWSLLGCRQYPYFNPKSLNPKPQARVGFKVPLLEDQGGLVSRLRIGINGVTIWVIGVINLLTKSP